MLDPRSLNLSAWLAAASAWLTPSSAWLAPACLQNSASYQAATGSMAWVNFQWSLGIPQHYQGPNGSAMSGACYCHVRCVLLPSRNTTRDPMHGHVRCVLLPCQVCVTAMPGGCYCHPTTLPGTQWHGNVKCVLLPCQVCATAIPQHYQGPNGTAMSGAC